jgi:NTE family protein
LSLEDDLKAEPVPTTIQHGDTPHPIHREDTPPPQGSGAAHHKSSGDRHPESAPKSSHRGGGHGGEGMTGLVLSGGGTRGAYEVGIIAGMLEALGGSHAPNPFQIAAGASVGAINAAFVAANAHAPGLNLDSLISSWTGMDFSRVFSPQLLSFVRQLFRGTMPPQKDAQQLGTSLLNPTPLEALVQETIDFERLHENVHSGALKGLFIAALQVATGKTTIFSELAPGMIYRHSKDPRRAAALEPVTLDHVLASTAIPLLFPARRVGNEFYCDGGLRLNTPIAPVIRAGAERLVIVSTTYVDRQSLPPSPETLATYPSLAFLTGKVLNALLVDPLAYDLQILARINDLVDIHQRGLQPQIGRDLQQRMIRRRGASYRHIETLVFVPSQDIARLAAQYLKDNLRRFDIGLVARRLLRSAAEEGNADWATYLLFDGGFAQQVIELGRRDALRRRDEIRAFCHA